MSNYPCLQPNPPVIPLECHPPEAPRNNSPQESASHQSLETPRPPDYYQAIQDQDQCKTPYPRYQPLPLQYELVQLQNKPLQGLFRPPAAVPISGYVVTNHKNSLRQEPRKWTLPWIAKLLSCFTIVCGVCLLPCVVPVACAIPGIVLSFKYVESDDPALKRMKALSSILLNIGAIVTACTILAIYVCYFKHVFNFPVTQI